MGRAGNHPEKKKEGNSEKINRNVSRTGKAAAKGMENSKEPLCPIYKKCGGCRYQGMPYRRQLHSKQRQTEKQLASFGKVERPYHYRTKVHAAFGRTKTGEIISGTYQEHSHKIVPVEDCLIEDEKCQEIIRSIRSLLKSFKIKTYDEDSGRGLFRHVLARRGFASGQIMVVLVLADPVFPSKNNFVAALRKRHPDITTILLNINDKKTGMVLGEREIVLFGPGYIEDTLCGRTFRISAKSFYQVNPIQTETLYRTAIDYAGLSGKETVLDAYCGIGTIGLIAADRAKTVIGVEQNGDAVRDARVNAKRNHIQNAQFYTADAGKFMTGLAEQKVGIDVVFLDPPRAGSDEAFLSALAKLAPKKVIYISCNPETLARDLQYLTRKGYAVKGIQPVDMFGWTEHVETVVLLSQRKPDDVIEVEIELGEMDLTSAESKATYAEIKDYVLKEHGLKVSNLYISQVKRKCGIEVGENYNLPKSEDSRQPQCPEEKEKAIKDALDHFGMI